MLTKYKWLIGVAIGFALIVAGLWFLGASRYNAAKFRYQCVSIGMTQDQVLEIFAGSEAGELQANDRIASNIDAQKRQAIEMNARLFGPDWVHIYYTDGKVVGKTVVGYDPYPVEDFPKQLPLLERDFAIAQAVQAFIKEAATPVPEDVEMVYWEWQSWDEDGEKERLTLWRDGRSERRVSPGHFAVDKFLLQPKSGWKAEGSTFVRSPAFPAATAKQLFLDAFRLGIHLLKPVKADYVDGTGLAVGIQQLGKLSERVSADFDLVEGCWKTENYIRYRALRRVLGTERLEMGYIVGRKKPTKPANVKEQPEESLTIEVE